MSGDMSQQVTVRLPDELVTFMDRQVREGRAASRAAVVAAAIERERRREIGERDAAILAAAGSDDDGLDELARFTAGAVFDDLDRRVRSAAQEPGLAEAIRLAFDLE
jgi:Arc/MetJ-type ribon-helix-helix transcriptional regulator